MSSSKAPQRAAWPIVTLADVADQCLGKMLDSKKNKGRLQPYLANPNVRWFAVDTSNVKLMPFEAHEEERYGLRAGDVVICEGGEAGRAAIWDGRVPGMKFQKAIHRVRPREALDARFLVHRLLADFQSGRLNDYYTGATIKHFTGQDLARYRFPLPPICEQRRIAAILDQSDNLRSQRRRTLALLDNLEQSLFLHLFGDPIANERGWKKGSVSDFVAGFESGKSLVADDEDGSGSAFRVLKISAVTSLQFRADQSKALPTGYMPPESHMVRAGDLLFSRANTTELIGATAFVHEAPNYLVLPDKLWRFVWHHPARVAPLYVRQLFRQPMLRHEIGQRASGTSGSMKNISKEKVLSIPLGLPPLELQLDFATRIHAIEALKAKHRASLAHLDALFASLQHRAFRGEL